MEPTDQVKIEANLAEAEELLLNELRANAVRRFRREPLEPPYAVFLQGCANPVNDLRYEKAHHAKNGLYSKIFNMAYSGVFVISENGGHTDSVRGHYTARNLVAEHGRVKALVDRAIDEGIIIIARVTEPLRLD